jgi:hypothetical protein
MKYNALVSFKLKPSFFYIARCSTSYVDGQHVLTETDDRGAVIERTSGGTARGILTTMLTILCVAVIMACGTQSRKMAGEGAISGAAVGAVGGLVSALVFGGDVGEGAARGAVWGGSTGAAAGAIAGARADSAQKKAQQDAKIERLKAQLGEDGFKGLEALAECKHEVAIAYARTARRSSNKDYSLAGLWVEALALADQGKTGQVRAGLPDLIAKDPDIGSPAQAEETLRKSLQKLQEIRAEYDLPRTCGYS